ncbi:MAG TPA: AAA family ATPase [Terracidiphilus sp.]|jgi:energy-coupling factor transporter ATP-binding protein EcfA2|nr:AAA family ATPase [Terracidiphilus sp.]
MISELKIRNFKSLESVDLKLGHFNLLVGANASGKSNFLDALRFLQGVSNSSLSIDEILDGSPPSSSRERWPGIRGGSKSVAFRESDGTPGTSIEFFVTLGGPMFLDKFGGDLTYNLSLSLANDNPVFLEESLTRGGERAVLLDRKQDPKLGSQWPTDSKAHDFSKIGTLPIVSRILKRAWLDERLSEPKLDDEVLRRFDLLFFGADFTSTELADMQFLDPLPTILRGYSSKVARLGENGEGFAALIHEITSNGSKPALLEWLKELRPDEIDDIYALEGLNNDFMVAIKEGNKEFRGPVLSEGTLRFIALAAAFFQPSMPKILVIEEIEKGLHPSRLRLLLELMRSQSKRSGTQVFATTHSPTLLNWLTEEDRKTTFVCTRDAESGATKMRSLAEVPNLEELIKKNYNLDQLFEEGWLESVLHES